jgi:ATP-binding cassette, subfamily B, bacterial
VTFLPRPHRLTPPQLPDRKAKPGTFRRIAATFKPYRAKVAVVGILILVISAIGLINPLLIKVVFDDVILASDKPADERLQLLWLVVGAMIATPIINGALGLWQTYLNNIVGQSVMRDLRNSLYAHLQNMPLKFFTSTRTGEIQSRLSNDVGGVQGVLTDTASSTLANVSTALGTVGAMALLSWELTLMSLGILPFFLWLSRKVGRVRREISGQTQESLADLTAHMQETLSVSGILLSKSFGRQNYEIGRFRGKNDKLFGLEIRRTMVGRGFFALIQVFFSIMPAFVYLGAGWLFLRGSLAGDPRNVVGTIVAFTTLQSRLFFPLGQLLNVNVEIQSSLALFDRIYEYLDLERDIVDHDGAIELAPNEVTGRIVYDDVWFKYGSPSPGGSALQPESEKGRLWTISGVEFEAKPGQLVALVGPSGAGKTTLTYLLPRLYDVNRGAVKIDDIDVRDIRLESLGDVVGMVTQETYLFNASVRENLSYGNPDATDDDLERAARAANIWARIQELDDGFDTVVGERGYKMSGGEKQRLAIARVILKNPSILVLDEATSALDTHSERLVQSALRQVIQGRTTVAIAHRLSTILAADQILYIDRGRIIERGTHAELIERDGAYAALYHEQFSDGAVETRCEDGFVLANGEVVAERVPD